MPDHTNADRQRRWRERQAGRLSPSQTCACGRRCYGQHAPLCSRCWVKTAEGREFERLRVARISAAKRVTVDEPASPDRLSP